MDSVSCKGNSIHQQMIFRNGRLIFPDGIRDGLELVVRGGEIAAIRPQSDTSDDEIVDLRFYKSPAFTSKARSSRRTNAVRSVPSSSRPRLLPQSSNCSSMPI